MACSMINEQCFATGVSFVASNAPRWCTCVTPPLEKNTRAPARKTLRTISKTFSWGMRRKRTEKTCHGLWFMNDICMLLACTALCGARVACAPRVLRVREER